MLLKIFRYSLSDISQDNIYDSYLITIQKFLKSNLLLSQNYNLTNNK